LLSAEVHTGDVPEQAIEAATNATSKYRMFDLCGILRLVNGWDCA
jgi:hypothetical protein